MICKLMLFCAIVVLAEAGYLGGGGGGWGGHDEYAYPKYGYEYGVSDHHTDDHKNQEEIRDGGLVKGSYENHEKDRYKSLHYVYDSHYGKW